MKIELSDSEVEIIKQGLMCVAYEADTEEEHTEALAVYERFKEDSGTAENKEGN